MGHRALWNTPVHLIGSRSNYAAIDTAGPSTLARPHGTASDDAYKGRSFTKASKLMLRSLFVPSNSEKRASSCWTFSTHPVISASTSEGESCVAKVVKLPARENSHSTVFRFSAAVIMGIVYDYDVAPSHDPLVELFKRGTALAMESLTPESSSVIDAFPFGKCARCDV